MPLELLTSYLTNRQQYTVINRIKSSSQLQFVRLNVKFVRINPRVFSFSLIGLYQMINDLPLASNLKTRLFADDANLTLPHKSSVMLEDNINHELP